MTNINSLFERLFLGLNQTQKKSAAYSSVKLQNGAVCFKQILASTEHLQNFWNTRLVTHNILIYHLSFLSSLLLFEIVIHIYNYV